MPLDRRYIHRTDLTIGSSPETYRQGQQQAILSAERFHYLYAAATEAYSHIGRGLRGIPFAREGLEFSAYTPFKLEPVTGLKLHIPRPDGSVNPRDIEPYVDGFQKNWKCREGGILYCVAESREFWNMIMNFHSTARTTGIESWDDLLFKLKLDGPDTAIIPCMWFARASGCLDPRCPFLHDRDACLTDRNSLLDERRATLEEPTVRDVWAWYRREMDKFKTQSPQMYNAYMKGRKVPEQERIRAEEKRIKHICSQPTCLNVHWRTVPEGRIQMELKKCSQCQSTYYCSAECQKKDWKRHKAEPCLPYEEMVNNDDIWSDAGIRKKTGNPQFQFADE